jgi:hypothetical protein
VKTEYFLVTFAMVIFLKDFTEYTNFEECLAYMEDYMLKHGPFDGVLGFSMVRLSEKLFYLSI